MDRLAWAIVAALAVGASACGATTRGAFSGATPTLTNATVTFVTRDDGKDDDTAVTVQLLRNGNELGAEATSVGREFDDNTVARPMALAMTAPFYLNDINESRLRVRMTPDDDDDWTFDVNLMLTFSDGTRRTFSWDGIKLDEDMPERSLPLASARR